MRSPAIKGVASIGVVLALAFAVIWPFDYSTFVSYVSLGFMAAAVPQITMGLYWRYEVPSVFVQMQQPWKGLLFLTITLLMAIALSLLLLATVGRGLGPTPMLLHYTILSIITVLILIPVWDCWPFTVLTSSRIVVGSLSIVASYLIALALWLLLFDYAVMSNLGAPIYHDAMDPKGWFSVWVTLPIAVTIACLVMVAGLFDFQIFSLLAGAYEQPVRGAIVTLWLLLISILIYLVIVTTLSIDPVVYMTRGPVCTILGVFLVSNMMQFSLFPNTLQPVKGVYLLALTLLSGFAAYHLYKAAAALHAGYSLGSGAGSGYELEVWISTAMLGVTFPLIFVVSGFFEFWPVQRKRPE